VLSKARSIPGEIKEYLYVDRSIPQGLRWKKPRSRNVKIDAPAGTMKSHGCFSVQFKRIFYLNHRVMYFIETGIDPGTLEVDHLWHNDNRGPLRLVTHQQNQFYRRSRRGSRSKYKGVSVFGGKWKAVITKDGVRNWLGLHETEEEAAAAYNLAARRLFGEHALLNEIGDPACQSPIEGD
jgi:hypothetical protein